MGSFSVWHWLIVLVIVLLVFGAGKIPRLMGDVAKGVKAFKKGLNEDDASSSGADAGAGRPQSLDASVKAEMLSAEKDASEKDTVNR